MSKKLQVGDMVCLADTAPEKMGDAADRRAARRLIRAGRVGTIMGEMDGWYDVRFPKSRNDWLLSGKFLVRAEACARHPKGEG